MDAGKLPILPDEFLIIRINAFTKIIDDGYLLQGGKRIGNFMTVAEIAAHLAANPKMRISALHV